MADNIIQVPANVEDPQILRQFLTELVGKLNSNPFVYYPLRYPIGYTGYIPNQDIIAMGTRVNSILDASERLDDLNMDIKTYITQSLQTVVKQNANDVATVTEQFGTFFDTATAAAWYGLGVKAGEVITGLTIGSVDTDTTTPGSGSSFFAINADSFRVARAIEDITDPAELAYVTALGLPYGTMYDSITESIIPAFLIEWNGASYDIFFNGKTTFSNITETGHLIETGSNISLLTNDSGFTDDTQALLRTLPSEVAAAVNNNTTTINGSKITTGTVAAAQIVSNTITANEIAANTITAGEIAANTITASEISANTITSNEMSTNVLLVGGQIESSSYSWGGGTPTGFALYSAGDPDSGSSYNIIGSKIYGGEITGTTINASTINIRNLNLVNDANYAVAPFFTSAPNYSQASTSPLDITFDTSIYTYNSTSSSELRTIGTTGTKIFLSEVDTTVIWSPIGYMPIAASNSLGTPAVYINVGGTTLVSKTSGWTVNTDYSLGGFVFRLAYDAAQLGDYCLCIKENTNDISLSSTSSSPISIRVYTAWSGTVYYRGRGLAMLVSNL